MHIHLLTLGTFAAKVAEHASVALGTHRISTHDTVTPPHAAPAFWPRSDLRVLITDRPSARLEDLLDQSVVDSRVPAAVITIEHPRLRLGPLLGTGGACLSCLHIRRAQHDPARARAQALFTAYDTDPTLMPFGHLPHHVRFAATWLRSVVEDLQSTRGDRHAGVVRSVNLHTGALGTDPVVGVHGCPRCRTTPPLAESAWCGLAADLSGTPGTPPDRVPVPAGSPARRAERADD